MAAGAGGAGGSGGALCQLRARHSLMASQEMFPVVGICYNMSTNVALISDPGGTMTHVSLDSQDEKVRQFVLALAVDPSGSVLELNGQAVVCIVAPPRRTNGTVDAQEWTEEKNARRVALIERKHAAG